MAKPTMTLITTSDAFTDDGPALRRPGVYLLLWAAPASEAEINGATAPEVELVPICARDADVSMHADLREHILGTATGSLTRAALGLMLQERLTLEIMPADKATGITVEPEQRLSAWLLANTVIGYSQAGTMSSADLHEAFASGDMNIDGCSLDEVALLAGLNADASRIM